MNREFVEAFIVASYALLEVEPIDRLDYLAKALDIKQVMLGCLKFLDDLRGSPYIAEYTKEDLALIHEAFSDSTLPLLLMLEHFLEKSQIDADKRSLAV